MNRAKNKCQPKITSFFPSNTDNQCNSSVDATLVKQIQADGCNDFSNICYLPMYYQNVRSIPAKTDIRSRISHSLYKVLCFSETWLSKDYDDECYFPLKFASYRCDRETNGGGVAVLVHSDFKSTQIEQIRDPDCESICVKIELKPIPLVIYLAYVNDSTKDDILLKHYNLVQQLMLIETDSRIVVLGDFNLHNIVWNLDDTDTFYLPQNIASHTESVYFRTALEFLQKMQELPMFQLSNATNVASNVLDLVFVNGTDDVQSCNAPVAITKVDEIDVFHPPLEISYEYHIGEVLPSSSETIEVYSYKRGNFERMSQELNEVNFAEVFNTFDVESAFDYFFELINSLIVENIPKVRIRRNNNRPKWWTREWQQKKNKRDKMYKRKPKGQTTAEYTQALKEFNELDEKLNKDYIDRVQENIIDNPSEFWSYAKIGKKTAAYPLEMQYNGRKCDNPQEIVEMFADYFEGLYVKDDDPYEFDEVYGHEPDNAWEVDLTMLDIEKAIKTLDEKSSAGPDNISPIVIKECADVLVWPLWILHQKSMELGKISSKLKISRVVPVYKKKGKKMDVKNYRITAISSVIMRIYESAVQLKLLTYLDPRLSNTQHGFRPKRSITTNLMNLSIAAHDAFSKGQQLDTFYGDFENAFDKLWHRILIVKIKSFGIGKKTAKWLFEFVVGREFYVKIANFVSRIYRSSSGVPAGSILGPTMFLIGVNDIADCVIHALALLFADDIKLAMMVNSVADVRCLQSDINNVVQWSQLNRLPFNLVKCEIITYTRCNDPLYAEYSMGDHIVERKDEIRDLGILVDLRFTLIAHRERMITKARQSLGYIKSISKGQFGLRALKVLYMSYVRSKLEFGSVIWDPYQITYSDDIESVQKQFLMYALGDVNRIPPFRLPPYEARCEKLGLDSLAMRRTQATAMMAFDLYSRRIHDVNIEKKLIRRTPVYSIRDNRVLAEVMYRTDYGYNQPIARVIRSANENEELLSLSRTRFKNELRKKLKHL